MTPGNGNGTFAHVEPQVMLVKKSEIPECAPRGRISFLTKFPFWSDVLEVLENGLAPAQAVEIALVPITTETGKKISPVTLLSAIQHQFQKMGLSKRYSLLIRNNRSRLFITDNATAAIV
jgi:hypothetical protein